MHAALLQELRTRRLSIRTRWGDLLRAEPVSTPLALPDALVHLIDTTLEAIFTTLAHADKAQLQSLGPPTFPTCSCGQNPYLTYFTAAEQALHEGLILAQAAHPPSPPERDASLAELRTVLALTARHEIESFCSVCQFRLPSACSHELTTDAHGSP
jgi:hypothetical protein